MSNSAWHNANPVHWNWGAIGAISVLVGVLGGFVLLIVLMTHHDNVRTNEFKQACGKYPHSLTLIQDGPTRACLIPDGHGNVVRVKINY